MWMTILRHVSACFPECESYEYRCDSGECIFDYASCDGIEDCDDGSDESGCDTIGVLYVYNCHFTTLYTLSNDRVSFAVLLPVIFGVLGGVFTLTCFVVFVVVGLACYCQRRRRRPIVHTALFVTPPGGVVAGQGNVYQAQPVTHVVDTSQYQPQQASWVSSSYIITCLTS